MNDSMVGFQPEVAPERLKPPRHSQPHPRFWLPICLSFTLGDCRYTVAIGPAGPLGLVFRTSRIFSRLIWLRVPPPDYGVRTGGSRDQEAVGIVMVERVLTLDLPWHRYFFGKFPTLNSFAVALKHHLRYNSRPNHLL